MILKMKTFGISLAGREYGKTIAEKIITTPPESASLDFTGVLALGSSFGDEIFKKLKQLGHEKVSVSGCNKVVREALKEIESELGMFITGE